MAKLEKMYDKLVDGEMEGEEEEEEGEFDQENEEFEVEDGERDEGVEELDGEDQVPEGEEDYGTFEDEGDDEGEDEKAENVEEGEGDEQNVTTNITKDRPDQMNQMLAKEDLGIVHSRINDTVKILSNFKEMRDPNKKRKEYLQGLMKDVSTAYDYNLEMVNLFFELFSPAEAVK